MEGVERTNVVVVRGSGQGAGCYESRLKGLSQETTLVLSNTRELDRVSSTE